MTGEFVDDSLCISDLPDEIICHIIEFFHDPRQVQKLLSINHKFRQLTIATITIIYLVKLNDRLMLNSVIPVQLLLSLAKLERIEAPIKIESGPEMVAIATMLPRLQRADFTFPTGPVVSMTRMAGIFIENYVHTYCHSAIHGQFSVESCHRRLDSASFSFNEDIKHFGSQCEPKCRAWVQDTQVS